MLNNRENNISISPISTEKNIKIDELIQYSLDEFSKKKDNLDRQEEWELNSLSLEEHLFLKKIDQYNPFDDYQLNKILRNRIRLLNEKITNKNIEYIDLEKKFLKNKMLIRNTIDELKIKTNKLEEIDRSIKNSIKNINVKDKIINNLNSKIDNLEHRIKSLEHQLDDKTKINKNLSNHCKNKSMELEKMNKLLNSFEKNFSCKLNCLNKKIYMKRWKSKIKKLKSDKEKKMLLRFIFFYYLKILFLSKRNDDLNAKNLKLNKEIMDKMGFYYITSNDVTTQL